MYIHTYRRQETSLNTIPYPQQTLKPTPETLENLKTTPQTAQTPEAQTLYLKPPVQIQTTKQTNNTTHPKPQNGCSP